MAARVGLLNVVWRGRRQTLMRVIEQAVTNSGQSVPTTREIHRRTGAVSPGGLEQTLQRVGVSCKSASRFSGASRLKTAGGSFSCH
jgi:SOS-response transcriptional repressor LexA